MPLLAVQWSQAVKAMPYPPIDPLLAAVAAGHAALMVRAWADAPEDPGTWADVAVTIRSDATAWGWVAETPASDLARQYLSGNLPTVAQNAIGQFLAQYGMRGVAEIDLGVPRWRDDPTPVMNNLKSYVAVSDPRAHPRALHTERQHEAGRSIRLLMDASPRARARQIRDWARSIRGMFGARETPKFTIVRAFGLLREHLDASARELVEAGRLSEASDVYFLHTDELRRAFTAEYKLQFLAEYEATDPGQRGARRRPGRGRTRSRCRRWD